MSFVDTLAAILLAGVVLILLWMLASAIRNPVLMKLSLRNIPRRPAQSLLITLGLTLSTIIFVSSLSLGDTLNYSVQRNAIDAYGAVDEIIAPPILSLLAGLGDGDATVTDPATEAEANLNNLLEGGLTSLLTVLEGGLLGISQERFEQLQAEAAQEPLIDAVAGSIIFPTIIRDLNSGQGEPLGFIFAVDSAYDQNFGLTDLTGQPVQIENLQPGVSPIFAQVANFVDLIAEAGAGLGLKDFGLSDAVVAVAGGAAALTALAAGEGVDLASLSIDLATLQGLGVDTTPLEEAGIEALSLEALGLDRERLAALGVTTTTVSLASLGVDTSGVVSSTSNLLGSINLNTLGSDIDSALGQAGLQLRQGDVYLNRLGAEQLDAQIGDMLEVYIGPLPVRFRVRAIVEEAGPMGALLPVVMMPLEEAQQLLFMRGKINNVLVSNLGDEQEGIEVSGQVDERLRILAMDPAVLETVVDILRRPQVRQVLDPAAPRFGAFGLDERMPGPPAALRGLIGDVTGFDDLAEQIAGLPAELDKPGISAELRALLARDDARRWLNELNLPSQDASELDRALRQLNEFDVLEPLSKSNIVAAANVGGALFTSVFTLFGLLSIVAATLLIFLIFVMLAAERRSEMGVARAIGVQRGHIIRMFVSEGLIYDLAAAALGVILGLAISYAMIGFIGGLFSSAAGQLGLQANIFDFYFQVVPASLIIAYSAGVLFTFAVVWLAAWRVSRMNIVAAIRDLPENEISAGRSIAVELLRFLAGPILLIGGILLVIGPGRSEREAARLGLTSLVVGASLLAGSVLQGSPLRKPQSQRLVYTVIGLGLILIWATPWPAWLDFSASIFDQDPNLALLSFALTGPLVILGAILVVIFNADAWTWGANRLLGGVGALTPVLKTAVAYPLSSRFRTGTTMLLFAMVISTVTIMTVVIEATQTLVAGDASRNAGFEIRASFSLLSFFDPMEDLAAEIAARPDFPQADVVAIGGAASAFVDVQQLGPGAGPAGRWRFSQLSGVDAGYLDQAGQFYAFRLRAPGYDSDAAVWQALAERDDAVVITADLASGRFDFEGGGPNREFRRFFQLSGAGPDATALPDIRLALQPTGEAGSQQSVQVIGVLEQSETLAGGWIQGNLGLLDRLAGELVAPDNYFVKVNQGADVAQVAAALERTFLGNALETSILAESDAAAQAVTRGILRLFQGFLALGLLVGIAALGVISTRSVVERRQQIGMLRAIGYQSNMVALSFLLESGFIALTGIVIGVIGGVVLGREIVNIFFSTISPNQSFPLPWLQIGGIVLAAYLFSLLTTLLPAYQAARIYPAEALRYE